MKCRLVFYVREERPPYGFGASYAAGKCETHNMDCPPPYTPDTMCPLGRIEQAVEDGIAAIEAAKAHPSSP